jgi:hypothetical protein
MSANIDQIYTANPATSFQPTDLMYLGRSPYGTGNDMGFLFSTLLAALPNATIVVASSASQAMSPNSVYIINNGASLVTLTLPVTAAVGTTLRVVGVSADGWSIVENSGQSINDGILSTTSTSGSLSSTQRYNAVELICVVANTTWNVISGQGNFTIV